MDPLILNMVGSSQAMQEDALQRSKGSSLATSFISLVYLPSSAKRGRRHRPGTAWRLIAVVGAAPHYDVVAGGPIHQAVDAMVSMDLVEAAGLIPSIVASAA